MQQVLQLSGSLTVSPPSVTGTTLAASPNGTVPAGTSQVPFASNPPVKQSAVQSGLRHKSLNSPSALQVLSGLGTNDDVTTADTLYLKTDAPITLQLTTVNPAGGSPLVSIVPLFGTMFWEFPTPGYLTGLQAQGVANIEMLVSGPA